MSILVYTNLDCIDGKQARRTGTSSPLGQLFDHGCDAVALHVMLSLVQASLAEPPSVFASVAAMSVGEGGALGHCGTREREGEEDGAMQRAVFVGGRRCRGAACAALGRAGWSGPVRYGRTQAASRRSGILVLRATGDRGRTHRIPTYLSFPLPPNPTQPSPHTLANPQVYLPWWVSHWEEYHTGVLMYGDGNFGILEANYVLALVTFITGTFGPAMWDTPMRSIVPVFPWDTCERARARGRQGRLAWDGGVAWREG